MTDSTKAALEAELEAEKATDVTANVEPQPSRLRRRHDIGELCARHGGGGHAVVGGVTLRGDELPRARETLTQLVRELTT